MGCGDVGVLGMVMMVVVSGLLGRRMVEEGWADRGIGVGWDAGIDPALGHPIEYISLDGAGPQVCKYCGLRYYQGNAHGHH